MPASFGAAIAPAYGPQPVALDVAAIAPAWNDVLIIIVGQKETTGSAAITQASGPTLIKLGEKLTSVGVAGADTGPTRVAAFARVLTLNETSTVYTFTGSADVMYVAGTHVTAATYGVWTIDAVVGEDTTAGAAWSAVMGALNLAVDDYLIGAAVIPTDVTTPAQFTAEAITAAGFTFSAATEQAEPDTALGNDLGGFIFRQAVATGTTATVAPTITATVAGTTTNVYGPTILVRLRIAEADPNREASTYLELNVGAVIITDVGPREDGATLTLNIGVAEVEGTVDLEAWGFEEDLTGALRELYYKPGSATYLYVNVT